MKALSIDLGGSHATLALVDDRTILSTRELNVDSAAGLRPILPVFKKLILELLHETGVDIQECIGLALCIAAMAVRDRVVSTNKKFEDAPHMDLPGWCRQELGIPLAIENDARMALLGEWYAGAAQGLTDVVMITLGTGIGGAVLNRGKVYRSSQVQGGCLGGHIPVLFTGRKCTCGAYGCMEAEAAGWSLPLIAREWPGFAESKLAQAQPVNFRALFDCARQGDRVAVEVRDRCLHVWAVGSVGLVHAYGPQRIVIGGGVMRSADVILPYIQDYVSKYAWAPSGNVEIVAASLGNNAALLGAIPLLTAED